MKPSEIHEGLDYHYTRVTVGTLEAGKGEVKHMHQAKSGWYIHLQDTKTKRLLKLRPAHIKKRVLVRVKAG